MSGKDTTSQAYERLFLEFSALVEKWIRRIIITLLAAMILFQLLLAVPGMRRYLTWVDRLEGRPFPQNLSSNAEGTFGRQAE